MDKLMAAVKDALNSQTRLLKVENLDCYKTIQVTADNADLNQMCANLNRYKDIISPMYSATSRRSCRDWRQSNGSTAFPGPRSR